MIHISDNDIFYGFTPEDVPEPYLFWLAGILEAEGCFSSKCNKVNIILEMADLDVMQLAANILQAKLRKIPKKNVTHKLTYRLQLSGDTAARWMTIIKPKMGNRRKIAIDQAIAIWYALPGKGGSKLSGP